jgi:hypothetical protein
MPWEATEKLISADEKQTAGAEARLVLKDLAARVNSCPSPLAHEFFQQPSRSGSGAPTKLPAIVKNSNPLDA